MEARYRGKARYYPGRIALDRQDGTYDIDYDDGEKERMVDKELVKVLDDGSGRGLQSSRDDCQRSGGGGDQLEVYILLKSLFQLT